MDARLGSLSSDCLGLFQLQLNLVKNFMKKIELINVYAKTVPQLYCLQHYKKYFLQNLL